jgi:origin recognition complex subunit 2
MKRKKQVREEEAENGQEDERTSKKSRSANSIIKGAEKEVRNGFKSTTKTSSRGIIINPEDRKQGTETADDDSDQSVQEKVEEVDEAASEADSSESESAMDTPVKQTPRKSNHGTGNDYLNGTTPTKSLFNKSLFSTPVKINGFSNANDTPRIERNADRSARRKSTRNLIERTILGNTSDHDEEEDEIAEYIYNSEDEDGSAKELAEEPEEAPITPSKRGRPKGSKSRKRSPTPPRDLEAHEKYFFQNRGGHAKTSNNDLSSLALLDHEEYFSRSRTIVDHHSEDIKFLEQLHAQYFNQWQFELSQDFNICAYGWGSKRDLLMQFADYLYKSQSVDTKAKIVVVNGYVNNLTIRDILNTIASAIAERGQKLGSQPADMLENLLGLLEEEQALDITLIIHSIDRIPLRRPTTQTILSRLSSHPQVHLIASADHPSFPLLWDSSLRSTYNFLFHDCTTFRPYSVEVDVVDEVHDLLGRSGRRVGGKEGVSFVLKSLPENAKNLFRVLIAEQLAAMDDSPMVAMDGDGDDENDQRATHSRKTEIGVEYRVLYQKAVEEFICSNEMNFRTLLKE